LPGVRQGLCDSKRRNFLSKMKVISLPCKCELGWDERETSLIMCNIHYNAYLDAGLNTAADDFIKKVASPKGSHYSHEILESLR
jgi:hypothetical protein